MRFILTFSMVFLTLDSFFIISENIYILQELYSPFIEFAIKCVFHSLFAMCVAAYDVVQAFIQQPQGAFLYGIAIAAADRGEDQLELHAFRMQ